MMDDTLTHAKYSLKRIIGNDKVTRINIMSDRSNFFIGGSILNGRGQG